MRIKKVDIYGFGKWVNQSFDFSPTFQTFLGVNESGKSTLHAFIHAILFGFPKSNKNHKVNQYTPISNGKKGGKIYLENTPYGDLTIERINEQPPYNAQNDQLKIILENGEQLPNGRLENILYGIDLALYQQFYSLNLEQLNDLKQLNEDNLEHYFFQFTATGNDQLFDLQEKWKKDIVKLYKKTGTVPELNQKLLHLKQLEQKVSELTVLQQQYVPLSKEIDHIKTNIADNEQHIKKLEKNVVHTEALVENYDMYQLYMQLNDTIDSPITDDIIQNYAKVSSQLLTYENDLIVSGTRLEQLEKPLSTQFEWYKNHSTYLKQGIQLLPKIESLFQKNAQNQLKIDTFEENILQWMKRYHIDTIEQIPTITELDADGIAMQRQLMVLQENYNHHVLQHEKISSKIGALEQLQLSEAGISRAEKAVEKTAHYWLGASGIGIGISLFMMQLFLQMAPILWIVGGISIVIGMWLMVNAWTNNRKIAQEQQQKQQVLMIQQANAQQQLNGYREELIQIERQIDDQLQQLNSINDEIDCYKQKYAIPESMDFLMIDEHSFVSLNTAKTQINQLKEEQFGIQEKIEHVMTYFALFKQEVLMNDDELTSVELVSAFKRYINEQQSEEKVYFELESQKVHLKEHIDQVTAKRHKLQNLLQHWFDLIAVNTVEEFENYISQLEKSKQEGQQKAIIAKQLQHLLDDFARGQSFEQLKALNQQFTDTLYQLKNEKERLNILLGEKQQALRQLEQDGNYIETLYEQSKEKEATMQLIKQVASLMIASNVVKLLLFNGKQYDLKLLFEKITTYFKYITNNQFISVVLESDTIKFNKNDHSTLQIWELSKGTLEQFYICFRLAFIQFLQMDMPLPIIIDDCFVNFDEERKKRILNVLQTIAQDYQIIYFTYDEIIKQQTFDVIELIR